MGFRKIRKGVAVVLSAALLMSSFPNVGNKSGFSLNRAEASTDWVNLYSESSSNILVDYNSPAELKVVVESDDPDDVTLKWKKFTGYDEYGYGLYEDTGVTGDTFTVENVDKKEKYRCEAFINSDEYYSVYCYDYCEFTVGVNNNLSVSLDYSYTVEYGQDFIFSPVVTADDSTGLKYTWSHYNNNTWENEIIGTEKNLTVEKPTVNGECYYFSVEDQYGNTWPSYSGGRSVYLYLDNKFTASLEGYENTSISVAVPAGTDMSFKAIAEAINTDGIIYDWYADSDDVELEGDTDKAEIKVKNINQKCTLYCNVTDTIENKTKYLVARIYIDNGFSVLPEEDSIDVKLYPGESAELKVEVTATDTEGLSYQWYGPNPDNDYYYDLVSVAPSLTVDSSLNGEYYDCTVTDKYGNTATKRFNITVDNEFSAYAAGTNSTNVTMDVEPGSAVTLALDVNARDKNGMTITWYDKNGKEIEGENGTELSIEAVTASSNYYTVCVRDNYYNYQYIYFSLRMDNDFTASLEEADKTVADGTEVTFKLNCSGKDLSGLEIQWYLNGEDPDNPEHVESFDNQDEYTVTVDGKSISGFVYVQDGYGYRRSFDFSVTIDNQFSAYIAGTTKTSEEYRIKPGDTLVLAADVNALDKDGMIYSWTKNYEELSEAVGSSYTKENARSDDMGYYTLYIEDKYGNTQYLYFYVSIDNSLSAWPKGGEPGYVKTVRVESGADVTLEVEYEADDDSNMSFDWYVPEGAVVNGSSCTIPNVNGAMYVDCSVSDGYYNSTNVGFQIVIDNGFTVTANDSGQTELDLTVDAGSDVVLTATVSGKNTEGVSYQWKKDEYLNPEHSSYYSEVTIDGATDSTYTIPKIAESGTYYCTATDAYGNSGTIEIKITIENNLKAYVKDTKEINATYTLTPGEEICLAVDVSANDLTGLIIKWHDDDWNEIEGATGTELNLGAAGRNNYGSYTCTVADKYGNSKSVYFTVRIKNNFTASLENSDLTVSATDTVNFKVNVDANDTSYVNYTWYLYDEGSSYSSGSVPDSNKPEMSFTVASKSLRGYAVVEDGYGNSQSLYFSATIENNLKAFVKDTQRTYINIKAQPGQELDLETTVTADNMTGMKYSWRKDFNDVEGADSDSIHIDAVSYETAGYYEFIATDIYDNSVEVNFNVTVENQFKASLEEEIITVAPGDEVTFRLVKSGIDLTHVEIEWYLYDADEDVYKYLSGVTGDSCSIKIADKSEKVLVEISDGYGNDTRLYGKAEIENNLTLSSKYNDGNYVYVLPGAKVDPEVLVTANDMTGIEYLWYYYDNNDNQVIVSREMNYVITADAGRWYYFRAKDRFDNVVSTTLYVEGDYSNNDFDISRKNCDFNSFVKYNTTATLEVEPSGIDITGVTYKWYEIFDDDSDSVLIEGADSASFTTGKITERKGFRAVGQDRFGNTASATFYVGVENNFAIDYKKSVLNANVKPGDPVELKLCLIGDDLTDVTYEWWGITERVGTDSTLSIKNADATQQFEVKATDRYGNSVWAMAMVRCNHLTVRPKDGKVNITAKDGDTVKLEIEVSADDMDSVVCNWYDYDDYDYYDSDPIDSGLSHTFVMNGSGRFRVDVSDAYGNYNSVVFTVSELTANFVPTIDEEYIDSYGNSAEFMPPAGTTSVELKVEATSAVSDTLNYEWYTWDREEADYVLISGANGASYTVKDDGSDGAHEYRVIVTDGEGNEAELYADVYFDHTVTVLLGDVNLDGDINAEDLTALARHVAKIEQITDPAALINADVNKDGDINAEDLTALARHVAKIEPLH